MSQAFAPFTGFNQDKVIDGGYFETLLQDPIKVAKERNAYLYCGEFGVIDRKMDFGIVD